MFSLPAENWYRLIIWMAVGFVIYFAYGYKRSVLAQQMKSGVARKESRSA